MSLPIKLPFLEKKPKVEYFLALVLRDEKIAALIFEERAGKITIISKHEEPLTEILEKSSLEDLVDIIDKTISYAEDKLPADVEVKNTVFGVKDSWVEEKKIKKDYLTKLKHVCEQLSLSPIGFIVLSEAIAHLIRQEEGAPVTALLTEVGKDLVTVSLFRAGKLVETKDKPITTTPMHAVDEALKEFEEVEILPSRLILFHSVIQKDENKKDELAQQFIAHQWSKSLPFLHVPQISILPYGFDGKAIVAGAASQLGFTLTGLPHEIENHTVKSSPEQHDKKTEAIEELEGKKDLKEKEEEKTMPENKQEEVEDSNEAIKNGDNFGFVMDKDITTIPAAARVTAETTHHKKDEEKLTDDQEETNDEPKIEKHHMMSHEIEEDAVEEDEEPVRKSHKPKMSFIPKLPKIPNPLKKLSLPSLPEKKGLIIIPPVLVLLLIGLALLYFFKEKATVTLLVSPKNINETQKTTLSTKENNNFAQSIIAAKEVTVSLDGNVTTDTTGQKEVGDKAKGSITIYNSDESKKSFPAGTIITSDNNLQYTTDKDVTVASASGDIFTGIKSGTAQVTVTASKIGTEYNLPSNAKFSVEGSDTAAAKNDSAFSGGTKKKVTVVTQKDVDKLTDDLPKSLEAKAKDQLQNKLGADDVLASDFTKEDITKKSLDKQVDAEAKTVTLTGTVTFSAIAYHRDDLLNFAQSLLKERYSQQEISQDHLNVKITGLKDTAANELSGVAEINAGLLPRIDTKNIANTIAGKSYSEAIDYVKSMSNQVQDIQIKLSPNLPFLPHLLPRISKNITVVVQSSE